MSLGRAAFPLSGAPSSIFSYIEKIGSRWPNRDALGCPPRGLFVTTSPCHAFLWQGLSAGITSPAAAQPDERLRPPDIAIVERLGELELKSLRDEVAHVAEDRSGAPKYEWCRPISCILRRVDRVEAVFLRSLTSSSGAVMARRPPPWRRSGRRRYGRAPSAPVPARRCGKGRLQTRSGSRTRSRRCAP